MEARDWGLGGLRFQGVRGSGFRLLWVGQDSLTKAPRKSGIFREFREFRELWFDDC